MQVQRIQNNNTTFNAKLHIQSKESLLSNSSIAQLKNYAESIGKAKDEIRISIGKLNEQNSFFGEQGALGSYGPLTECKMGVNAIIGGEKYNKDLSWCRPTKYVSYESIIMSEIQDYLQILRGYTKK